MDRIGTRSLADGALEELSLAPSSEALWGALVRQAMALSGYRQAWLYEYREDRMELHRPEDGATVPLDEDTLEGWAGLYRTSASWFRGQSRPSSAPPAPDAAEVRICLPVVRYGRLQGLLTVREGTTPPNQHLAHLEELVQAAALMERFIASERRAGAFAGQAVDLLVTALEALHPEIREHTDRVARLAGELARLLDLSAETRERLWWAARVHDLGLLRLGGVTAEQALRLHPLAGADFLRAGEALAELAPLVEAHHERYDGSGVPHGVAGEHLPLEAWVLALAEDLEELRTREGHDYGTWLRLFFTERAPHHHPAVVDALGGLADSGRLEGLFR